MFMTAREIKRRYQPHDPDRDLMGHETDTKLWNRKAREADQPAHSESLEPTLGQGIRERGVEQPIALGTQFGKSNKPQVIGGHHRIGLMGKIAPDTLLPVIHHESFGAAMRSDQAARAGRAGYRYT